MVVNSAFTAVGEFRMPIYEYQCEECSHELEALQKMSDDALTDCPSCGKSGLRKLVSASAFRLKGSGWYETDFKSEKQKNLAKDDSASGGGSSSASSSDSSGSSSSASSGGSSDSSSSGSAKKGAASESSSSASTSGGSKNKAKTGSTKSSSTKKSS